MKGTSDVVIVEGGCGILACPITWPGRVRRMRVKQMSSHGNGSSERTVVSVGFTGYTTNNLRPTQVAPALALRSRNETSIGSGSKPEDSPMIPASPRTTTPSTLLSYPNVESHLRVHGESSVDTRPTTPRKLGQSRKISGERTWLPVRLLCLAQNTSAETGVI
jgi:hypothetical protein